jgi:hypothetical protein
MKLTIAPIVLEPKRGIPTYCLKPTPIARKPLPQNSAEYNRFHFLHCLWGRRCFDIKVRILLRLYLRNFLSNFPPAQLRQRLALHPKDSNSSTYSPTTFNFFRMAELSPAQEPQASSPKVKIEAPGTPTMADLNPTQHPQVSSPQVKVEAPPTPTLDASFAPIMNSPAAQVAPAAEAGEAPVAPIVDAPASQLIVEAQEAQALEGHASPVISSPASTAGSV